MCLIKNTFVRFWPATDNKHIYLTVHNMVPLPLAKQSCAQLTRHLGHLLACVSIISGCNSEQLLII